MRDLRNLFFFLFGFALSMLLMTAVYAQNDRNDIPADRGTGISNRSGQKADAPTKLSTQEQRFIRRAGEHNMAEMELGKLATQRGTTDAVKQFGERMVTDHGRANEE